MGYKKLTVVIDYDTDKVLTELCKQVNQTRSLAVITAIHKYSRDEGIGIYGTDRRNDEDEGEEE